MAIAIRGTTPLVTSTTANPISGTLTGARQPQAGDLLVIIVGNDFYALTDIATPTVGGSTSGVTAVTNGAGDAGNPDAHAKAWTFAVASTGDLTVSETVTSGGDEEKVLAVYVLSGADTVTPIDGGASGAVGGASAGSGQASFAFAGVTPSGSDAYLIYHLNSGGGTAGGTPYTPPAGMTEQYDGATGAISYSGGIQQLAASGATGTRTVTSGDSITWAGVLLAVKTGGAAAPPPEYAGPYRGPAPGRISPTGVRRPQPPGPAKPSPAALLGVADETDTALALGRTKTRALGIAAEADTAVAAGRVKGKTVGVAAETDAAVAVGRRKTTAVGIATETDTALTIGVSTGHAVGTASETDTALPLSAAKTRAVGVAAETDSAIAPGRRKSKAIAAGTASTAVRDFDGASGTRIETAAGNVAAITPSAHAVTMAFLWKPSGTSDDGLLRIQESGGTLIYGVNPFGGNLYLSVAGGGFDSSPYTYAGSDGWRLDVVTRVAGFTGQVRWHGYRMSVGTWTHTDGGTKPDPNNTNPAGAVWLGALDGSSTLDGELAAVGVWLSALSDVSIETLPASLQAWADLAPAALWALNQTSTADAVVDLTGGGADETADFGTSVVTGDAPPGFDFTFGGPPTEVDVALPLTGRTHTRALGIADEADAAGAVTGSVAGFVQPYAGPWTGMTPGWQSPTGQLSVILGNATVGNITTATLGVAGETDTAQPVGKTKTRALGTATETDTAQLVGSRHTRALGVAAETDTAPAVGRSKTRTIGIAATTDTAVAVGRAKKRLVGAASTTDTALPIGTLGHIYGAAGTATETDTAVGLSRIKRKTVGVATTTDAALAIARRKTRALGTALEVDVAVPFHNPISVAVGTAAEVDTVPNRIHRARRYVVRPFTGYVTRP